MRSKIFSKVTGATVSAALLLSSVPFAASAADDQKLGKIGGFDYEMWNMNCAGEIEYEPGEGTFTCKWSNIDNCLAMMGRKYDTSKKNYYDFGRISLTYDIDITPQGNATYGAYGWTRNPLSEYYIVEGWGNWRPCPDSKDHYAGSSTVNGHEYDVFRYYRYNQPSIMGTMSFPTYYCVRKESAIEDNVLNQVTDSIDITKHFKSMEALGFDLSGELYETMFYVEGYRSSGSAQLKKLHFGSGMDTTPVKVDPRKYCEEVNAIADAYGYIYKYDFDHSIYDWQPRVDEKLKLSQISYKGGGSMSVSGRTSSWQGPVFPISRSNLFAGDCYSIGAVVMQCETEKADFSIVCQYLDENGQYQFENVAEVKAYTGVWTDLSNTCYKIPENARNFSFFIETPDYVGDFYVDSAYTALDGVEAYARFAPDPVPTLRGDINCDGLIDVFDLASFRKGLLGMISGKGKAPANSDINEDGMINVADLVCLQRYLLGAEKFPDTAAETTTTTTSTTTTTTTTTTSASSTTFKTTEKKTSTTTSQSTTTTPAATTTTTTTAEKDSYEFNAQYINTNGEYDSTYPMTTIITNRDELDSYMTDYMESLRINPLFSYSFDAETFLKNSDNYTDEWFSSNKLVVVLLREAFLARDIHKVAYINKDEVGIERLKNGGDMVCSYWHIFIEVDKDAEINDDLKVSVTDSPDMDLRYPFG